MGIVVRVYQVLQHIIVIRSLLVCTTALNYRALVGGLLTDLCDQLELLLLDLRLNLLGMHRLRR